MLVVSAAKQLPPAKLLLHQLKQLFFVVCYPLPYSRFELIEHQFDRNAHDGVCRNPFVLGSSKTLLPLAPSLLFLPPKSRRIKES